MKRARVAAVVGLSAFAFASAMTACEGDDTLVVNPLDGGGGGEASASDATADAATEIGRASCRERV